MRVFRDFEEASIIKNAVVTTGSFDGVHVGHKVIIKDLIKSAKELNGESTLITFYPHPRKVLYPDTVGKNLQLINSQREKIELLRKTGIDNLIIVKFTPEFAKTSSIDFIRKILVEKLNAIKIIVGFNHHFGHNREGDYEYLKQLALYHNFIVEEIPEQDIQNESVSSTKIRKAISEGNMQRANAYLDHQYIIMGKLNNSSNKINQLGFISYIINIEEESKLVPPCGIYAVHLIINNTYFKGMAIITNDDKSEYVVLVNLFDVDDEDFNGADATLFFHKLVDPLNCIINDSFKDYLIKGKEKIEELIY